MNDALTHTSILSAAAGAIAASLNDSGGIHMSDPVSAVKKRGARGAGDTAGVPCALLPLPLLYGEVTSPIELPAEESLLVLVTGDVMKGDWACAPGDAVSVSCASANEQLLT
jgi:hypothetical protein